MAQGLGTPACPNTAGTSFRGLLDLAAVGTGHDAATVDTGVSRPRGAERHLLAQTF